MAKNRISRLVAFGITASLVFIVAGCGSSVQPSTATYLPPTATPAPPTVTPVPPTLTEEPPPTLNTSLGIFTVDEAIMVDYMVCLLDRSLPPCGQPAQTWEAWLIVYLKPLEGNDISQISPLPFLDQDIYVIDGTGERLGCIMTGDDGTRLYVGFPLSSSHEYTLYWPDNPPLILANVGPPFQVEVATQQP